NRVVLVIMTACAAQGSSHPGIGSRLDPIHDILDLIFFGDGTTLEIDHVVSVKPGGNLLFVGSVGQEIAGQLLDRKLVERQVTIECVYNPVAPAPHIAVTVDVVAV